MRLDHLSYAAGQDGLAACVQRIGAKLGAAFTDGGVHPSFGTRNFVLPLADGCYLEVVEALDHPAVDRAPFGRLVRDKTAAGGGWLAWVLQVDDLAPIERRLHRAAVPGHRRRPDGVDLRWWQIGINDTTDDPQLPYFISWSSDPADHPSVPGSAVRVSRLEFAGDEATVDTYLGVSTRLPVGGVQLGWSATEDETGLMRVTFETRRGPVDIF
ncbi:MAG: VOC family protein [Jatrophihabitans sp.]|uniref:VOC family protein n=1 Tax=Jatrophihabitans sp. TaxID=1932789 RepID=UPI003F80D7B8